MASLPSKAFAGLVGLFVVMAALLFGPPCTFDYWQAWVFLAVYFSASLALTLYLVESDPKLLERRMRGGPWAEKQPAQKIIMLFASAAFIGLSLVPALDRRFGWSHMSPTLALAGDAPRGAGLARNLFVFARTASPRPPSSWRLTRRSCPRPYALVRHPMCRRAWVCADRPPDRARLMVGRAERARDRPR
jgi:hypothetical protein